MRLTSEDIHARRERLRFLIRDVGGTIEPNRVIDEIVEECEALRRDLAPALCMCFPIPHMDGRSVPTWRCNLMGCSGVIEASCHWRLVRCRWCGLVLGSWRILGDLTSAPNAKRFADAQLLVQAGYDVDLVAAACEVDATKLRPFWVPRVPWPRS